MSDVRRRVLLVEGRDDQHILKNLFGQCDISCYVPRDNEHDTYDGEDILIIVKYGTEAVLEDFKVRVKIGDFASLGVIVDADDKLERRWASWRDSVSKETYPAIPIMPDPAGTVVERDDKAKIGIWIMPHNTIQDIQGMLEDFAKSIISPQDTLWKRAKDCVDQIPTSERLFSDIHLSKVYIHTWLAWQKKPGRPLGEAVSSNYLDSNSPYAQDLMNWARRLFAFAP